MINISEKRLRLVFFFMIIVICELLGRGVGRIHKVLPFPSELALGFMKLILERSLWQAVLQTSWKVFLAMSISVVLGYTTGFLVGMFRPLARISIDWVDAIRAIPTVLLIPVFFLFMDPGSLLVIGMATYPAMGMIFVGVSSSASECHKIRGPMCKSLGMRTFDYARHCVFWETLGSTSRLMATVLPTIVAMVVALEYFELCNNGLGQFVADVRKMRGPGYLSQMYSAILFVGLFGWLVARVPTYVTRRYLRWA